MAKALHAEISGGGLAALVAATRLGQAGWSVRVHERSAAIRDSGSGIYVWENGLRVLEAIGAYEEATEGAVAGKGSKFRGAGGEERSRMPEDLERRMRLRSIPRQQLLTALISAAERAGVEIRTGSDVAAASPDGRLHLTSGEVLKADIVIGADGVHSPVRHSLDLTGSFEEMPDGALRAMIPRRPEDGDDYYVEHWNGTRRILVTPVSRDQIYLALTCLHEDEAARAIPLDKRLWRESFPHLASMIDRIDEARWDRFVMVKARQWSLGHAAIVGDAAHAMTPNLGQGGGMAMQNALSLATELAHLGRREEIPAALARWEARERDLVGHTQTWSWLYGFLTTWPDELRSDAVFAASNSRWLIEQRFRTALSVPYGSGPEGLAAPASGEGPT